MTSILLTAEMTGSLIHMLPVAACSFIALLLSDMLKVTPIYEALLDRLVEKNKDTIKNEKTGGLLEIPVELGSTVAGNAICEIDWPQGTLIVGVRRGESEIVPNGNTEIMPGDYLVVISSESTYKDLNMYIRDLCQGK